jgi:hypothetical protein
MTLLLTPSDYVVLGGSIGSVATAVVAIRALVFAKRQVIEAQRQLRQSQALGHGDFLLRLDEALERHVKVHMLLQPDFAWGKNKGGPGSPDDWFLVTSYMGCFERVNFLIESRIEELEIVDKLYGYRVYNLVSNDIIRRKKLEDKERAPYWEEFIKLWLSLKSLHPEWQDYPGVKLPEAGPREQARSATA